MSDDRREPPADDATRPLPPGGDATRPLPPTGDATRPLPPGGGTTGAGAAGPPVWSGRAGVPPPRDADARDAAEWYGEDPRGRRWWTPILLGVLGLVLLGLVGVTGWLVLRAPGSSSDGTPTPPPTAGSTTGVAPTSATPSTAAPTTGPPTTPPTTASTTGPAGIPVPPLVGLPRETAQTLLGRLGLSYRVLTRESDRPPGTVLATDPERGEMVSPGDEVTLVVAAGPSASPTGTGGTATPTATPTG
ncbi:PASTA domain-containing protein [Micromonospora rifamycinica]|uniref:PASTA domain-containing protein n=1 Tax=Micromonospora rifamycinica TaxID=291594 RepID=UPI0033CE8518